MQTKENVKRSTQGRLAAATQKQTAQYLKPFFKGLKKKVLDLSITLYFLFFTLHLTAN
jgi:hypothetical protein